MSRRAIVGGGVAVALALVAGGLVGHAAHAAVGSAIAVDALAALLVVRELAGRVGDPVAGRAGSRGADELGQLRALDRAVDAAVASPAAFDRELRPLIRSIARTRLARRGIDADLSPEAAEAILGPEVMDCLRGGSAGPADARSRATATASLEAVIDRLETI